MSSQPGALAARAALQQDRAHLGEAGFVRRLLGAGRQEPVEDRLPLPVAAGADVVDRLEVGRVTAEQFVDLRLVPDVELALLALGIGIERARERALASAHLAQHPGHGLGGAGGEERLAGLLPDMAEQVEKLGVVVEHLLEMGREPALVGGIAREAAAEVVVDAALAHALHAQAPRRSSSAASRCAGSCARAAPAWNIAGTSARRQCRRGVHRSRAAELRAMFSSLCLGHGVPGLAAGESLQRLDQCRSVFVHLFAVIAVGLLDQT